VNGTAIRRARPSDFETWVAAGNEEWSWDRVLPTFRELEDDCAPGCWHAQGGPLHIHRFTPSELRPVQQAFLDGCALRGFPAVDDHNAPSSWGAGPIPLNQVDGIRQSAAVTHLAAARRRPNLSICPGVLVDRLELVGRSPRTVVLANGERLDADTVVLAAGVYGSPAILMRSGIGPVDDLRALGIKPLADLPAVGENLRDHPMFAMSFTGNREVLGELAPPVQTLLTFASDGSREASHVDMDVCLTTPCAPSDWFDTPPGTVVVGIGLVKPHSAGHMRIVSADPGVAPRIWLNFFHSRSDLDRLARAVGVVRDLFATPCIQPFVSEEAFPGPGVQGGDLDALIHSSTPSYAHGTGTCQMGTGADTAVVDQRGRVHGFEDLWIIDASIMPALPSVPTNFTTMMVAERCVAWMRDS
jgi:choline dehydrogenase